MVVLLIGTSVSFESDPMLLVLGFASYLVAKSYLGLASCLAITV